MFVPSVSASLPLTPWEDLLLITRQEIYRPGKLCSFVATEGSLSKEYKADD